MTDRPSPQGAKPVRKGVRARASERPLRCGRTKVEDGRPCRRNAGGGTDHPGEGPCAKHDDGSWRRVDFGENREAQQAFLAAVKAEPALTLRELIEPLGYRKRDVTQLAESDSEFEDAYVEARGYDADAIRNELQRRAFGGSDKLLEFVAKMRLPEGRELQRQRLDGRLEVQAIPMIDPSRGTLEELAELRRLLAKFSPAREALASDQRPALELLPGDE